MEASLINTISIRDSINDDPDSFQDKESMLNDDLDLDDQLERVQDDLQGALEESETDNAEDAAEEVQDSTCCRKANTCILYVIACAQDKNSCRKSQRGQLPMELNCYKSR